MGASLLLHRSVNVIDDSSSISLEFSTWKITLPTNEVLAHPTLLQFMRREIPLNEVCRITSWVDRLLIFLEAQGAIELDFSTQRPFDVTRLFDAFANYWYGIYYSNPLWRLFDGKNIDRRLIAHWMVRTYFLSRSAGVTAATAATQSSDPLVRSIFRKSAIEEYSHCDEYYLPSRKFVLECDDPRSHLRITPASLAFDQQMTMIARKDDLAHVFVALFQERTANFKQQAEDLYDTIELQFDFAGGFSGWKRHISYDGENNHAMDIELLLSAAKAKAEPDSSLHSALLASVAIEFLDLSLNEICSEHSRNYEPEQSLMACFSDHAHHKFILRLSMGMVASTAHEARSLVMNGQVPRFSGADGIAPLVRDAQSQEIFQSIHEVVFKILAQARGHAEILLAGDVAAIVDKYHLETDGDLTYINVGAVAIRNLLESSASTPTLALVLIYCLLASSEIQDNSIRGECLGEILETLSGRLSEYLASDSLTLNGIFLSEELIISINLIFSAVNSWDRSFRFPF